jgi:uncharacterized protein (TIGR04255 family)
MRSVIAINLQDQFPHLNNAPIVEAAVDLRARVGVAWEEASIVPVLKSKLADYPTKQSLSGFQQEVTLRPGVVPEGRTVDTGWSGLRCASADGLQIAQFDRNGFLFSRLHPYQDWERLIQEAMRFWTLFLEIGRPTEVQRLGVRFINRIPLPFGDVRIEDYLEPAPEPPRGLDIPCRQFFYGDTLTVPGYPYLINRIRTVQGPHRDGFAFILDIDVYTTEASEPRQALIDHRLAEMRWLKNKVFFGSVTEKALEKFK